MHRKANLGPFTTFFVLKNLKNNFFNIVCILRVFVLRNVNICYLYQPNIETEATTKMQYIYIFKT